MANSTSRTPSATHTRLSTVPTSASKSRQLSHLHSQLAQLTANMSDLENLLRMTAVQAEGMRGLGGYAGGMFMAASKVLGEETVSGANGTSAEGVDVKKAFLEARIKTRQEGTMAAATRTKSARDASKVSPLDINSVLRKSYARQLREASIPDESTPQQQQQHNKTRHASTQTTHSSTPRVFPTDTMAADHHSSYLKLINQLIEEKDRLVAEKDELTVSKDSLWREMYDIIREKDAKIEELGMSTGAKGQPIETIVKLKTENASLLLRNKALEEALKDLLDKDAESTAEDDTEDAMDEEIVDDDEHSFFINNDVVRPARRRREQESEFDEDEDVRITKIRRTSHEPDVLAQIKQNVAEEIAAGNQMPVDDVGFGRRFSTTALTPPTSLESVESSAGTTFEFKPLVCLAPDRSKEYGSLDATAPVVQQSIHNFLEMLTKIRKSVRSKPVGVAPSVVAIGRSCGWAWMHQSTSSTTWTTEAPRMYTCRTCFNARRACILWEGNMSWSILPLPPQLRRPDTEWTHAAYYIYQGSETHRTLPPIWEELSKSERARDRRK